MLLLRGVLRGVLRGLLLRGVLNEARPDWYPELLAMEPKRCDALVAAFTKMTAVEKKELVALLKDEAERDDEGVPLVAELMEDRCGALAAAKAACTTRQALAQGAIICVILLVF